MSIKTKKNLTGKIMRVKDDLQILEDKSLLRERIISRKDATGQRDHCIFTVRIK
jgi:hypothetical protein